MRVVVMGDSYVFTVMIPNLSSIMFMPLYVIFFRSVRDDWQESVDDLSLKYLL